MIDAPAPAVHVSDAELGRRFRSAAEAAKSMGSSPRPVRRSFDLRYDPSACSTMFLVTATSPAAPPDRSVAAEPYAAIPFRR
ncbi:hypothetical protein WR25_18071 [Diploscapter pachys]|uniref:Uncharacterized protein n=1 Tax=Diploscapter pachys TaxID=2018661 RepID=A0A2A2M596_9BILA|nr:hypothetical protein WR25_18071 [Diploscapter pachys]